MAVTTSPKRRASPYLSFLLLLFFFFFSRDRGSARPCGGRSEGQRDSAYVVLILSIPPFVTVSEAVRRV